MSNSVWSSAPGPAGPRGEERVDALAQYEKTGQRIPVLVFFGTDGTLSAPVHQGMSQDIARYKQMMRARVDALLAQRNAAPGAASGAK